MGEKIKVADLFSGCGGLTLGFTRWSVFEPVFALDNNKAAIETYRANFDPLGLHSFVMGIEDYLKNEEVPSADVVIGGPPCQGFSLLNKKRMGDSRRSLWKEFLRFADRAKAKVVVMENVSQLLKSDEFTEIVKALKRLGFHDVVFGSMNSANFGDPQTRQRAIVIASRVGPVALPVATHASPAEINRANYTLQEWNTVRMAIGDLPSPLSDEPFLQPSPLDLHFRRNPTAISLERYKAVPPGGNRFDLQENRPDITPRCWLEKPSGSTDIFGRLWWERPSVTIRTEFYKPEKGRYLHPSEDRPITHREAARLQSFPDDFRFVGSKIEIAKQIGNAVPIRLAEAVGRAVMEALLEKPAIESAQMGQPAAQRVLSFVG